MTELQDTLLSKALFLSGAEQKTIESQAKCKNSCPSGAEAGLKTTRWSSRTVTKRTKLG